MILGEVKHRERKGIFSFYGHLLARYFIQHQVWDFFGIGGVFCAFPAFGRTVISGEVKHRKKKGIYS